MNRIELRERERERGGGWGVGGKKKVSESQKKKVFRKRNVSIHVGSIYFNITFTISFKMTIVNESFDLIIVKNIEISF